MEGGVIVDCYYGVDSLYLIDMMLYEKGGGRYCVVFNCINN